MKQPRITSLTIPIIFVLGTLYIFKEKEILHVTPSGPFYFKTVEFSKLEYNPTKLINPEDLIPDPDHEFKPYTGNGVFTYRHVCFEIIEEFSGIAVDLNHVAWKKRIVVYNAPENKKIQLKVAADPFTQIFTWPIEFRKQNIPDDYVTVPYPAYFQTFSQPGNLYHLMEDTLHGTFGVIKKTNRLNSKVRNQVYSRLPLIPFFQVRSKNISIYSELFEALGIRSYPVYHAAPEGLCHEYGVFGYEIGRKQDMIDHVLKYFKIDDAKLCTQKAFVLTFIQRVSYRKVTNREELIKAAESLGFKVQSVKFETLPFIEQLKIARCTDVLLGLHGAALQWVKFMRPKRALIEMSYPGWPPDFLLGHARNGGISKELAGERDGAEWGWLRDDYNHGNPLPDYKILTRFYNSKYDVNRLIKVLTEIKQVLKPITYN